MHITYFKDDFKENEIKIGFGFKISLSEIESKIQFKQAVQM